MLRADQYSIYNFVSKIMTILPGFSTGVELFFESSSNELQLPK